MSFLDYRIVGLRNGNIAVRDVLVVVLLTLVSVRIHASGWLDSFESAWLDAFVELNRTVTVDDIVIVRIDDDDYANLFNSTSPLDTSVLEDGIKAIVEGDPLVVVVDLLIANSVRVPEDAGVPVVWARDAIFEDYELDLQDTTPHDGRISGIAIIPTDGDGVVRRYRRQYPAGQTVVDSLSWAAFRVVCRRDPDLQDECSQSEEVQADEELLFNFAGNRYKIKTYSFSAVIGGASGDSEHWRENGPLHDSIVVLGGTFRAARDQYFTSVGPKDGVEIVAQAISNDILGNSVRDASKLLLLFVEFLAGMLTVVVHKSFPLRKAFYISLIGLPIAALAFSLMTFSVFARWATFAPVFLGTLIHQLYESTKEAERALAELENAKAQLVVTRTENDD